MKVGDLVKLKDDKVIMTVHKVEGESVVCIWHDGVGFDIQAFCVADLEFIESQEDDVK
ncbi:MAG: hypothetical protein ACRDC0_05125 [Aeromonas veronii]